MSLAAIVTKYGWESEQMYLWYGSADSAELAREEQLRLSAGDRL